MKRTGGKALAMSVAAIVSAAVLGATAFAAATNVSGYESLKQSGFAVLERRGNSTSTLSVDLFADGEKVSSHKEISQINDQQDARYTRREIFQIGEGMSWTEHYWDSEHLYYVYSENPDQYGMTTFSQGDRNRGVSQVEFTENQKKLASILMDLFAGDIKNYFVMDGNTVSISLSRNQIPELVQSFLTVGAEQALRDRSDAYYYRYSQMDNILAQYLYDPVIESGSLAAVLSDNGCPADINARIDFSGKDISGVLHNASLIVNMEFNNIGNTQVKQFDPQGKTLLSRNERVFDSEFTVEIEIPEQQPADE